MDIYVRRTGKCGTGNRQDEPEIEGPYTFSGMANKLFLERDYFVTDDSAWIEGAPDWMPLSSLVHFYFTLSHTFSNEEPKGYDLIMLLTENSAWFNSSSATYPGLSETPTGEDIYIHGTISKGFWFKYYLDRESCRRVFHSENIIYNLVDDMIRSKDARLENSHRQLEETNAAIFNKANHIIGTLVESIDRTFSLANVVNAGLYDHTDIKSVSRNDWGRLKFLDQNVLQFIKTGRVYAGLAFLKNEILKLRYGFAVRLLHDEREGCSKIVFYTSNVCWIWLDGSDVDIEGHTLNKIIECLLMLLTSTPYNEPLISLYKNLLGHVHFKLKTPVLVRLVEAFIKHKELQLLKPIAAQLKTLEPEHKLIKDAEKVIRWAEVPGGINVTDIQIMGGIDFEKFLEGQFEKCGFRVERTKASGDFGADLIVETKSGTKAAVQAKRFKQKTNLKAVQEVVASLPHYAADFGIVIATAGFYTSAVKLAETNSVELWDEDKLLRLLGGDVSFSLLNE
jgi:Holliday junction resolvase